ncbi:ATP-dependent RNA helicase HrpA [Thermodesulfobacteriota bacterium]
MSISQDIKNIKLLLPEAILRDRAFILRRLKKVENSTRYKKKLKQSPKTVLSELLKKVESSKARRKKRSENIPDISYPEDLPITSKREEIVNAISNNQVLIISGETGSGKSTQIPKMCLEAGRGISGKIGCTQPRRIAASTISRRIAEELGEKLGKSVGYKIRFKDRTPYSAYIKVMTDGMLLAETQGDSFLYEYDTLIIDEAHERSLNIDFILGILRTLLPKRPELKIIITSATLDTEKFSNAFGNVPVIEISGRLYPVEVRYNPVDPDLESKGDITYVDMAVRVIDELKENKQRGDILVFMPTEQDIIETCERLEGRAFIDKPAVLPLFARLPSSSQQRIYSVKTSKIVVATNVAETSLTIPGIKYVIDTGLARIARYLPRTRTNSLPVSSISKSSADQRMGRAGRIQSGVCIRLYSEEDYDNREEYTPPEILRSNLAEVILRMINLRLGEPSRFPFIDPPGDRSIKDGFDLLEELGAVEDQRGKRRLTEKGRLMARMPLDPRISRMMLEACKEGYAEETAIIAGILSIQDPRERPLDKAAQADRMHEPFKDTDSDFITLLKIWKQYHRQWKDLKTQNKMRKFCREHFLSFPRMREWIYTHNQIMTIIKEQKIKISSPPKKSNPENRYAGIHRSILSGFLSNIAVMKEKNIYRATRGREVMIFPGSALFNKKPAWIVASEMVKTSRLFARNVARIDPEWLEILGGSLCSSFYQEPHWEKNRGEVRAYEKVTLFGLPIVPQRPVSYGPVNPAEAHDIFIRSGLVGNNVKQRFPFLKHNSDLLKKYETLENKLRRRNLLRGEDCLADFYSERLRGIHDVRSLARLIKEKGSDDFLKATDDDLLLAEPDSPNPELFPDELKIGSVRLKTSYKFSPGKDDDGLTIKIPSSIASGLSVESLELGVMGFMEEKITALIKGLPKRYRKQLVPVAGRINIITKEMETGEQPLLHTLSEFLYHRFGVSIPADVWDKVEIPDYLRTRVAITDHRGKEIKAGRDINALISDEKDLPPDSKVFNKLKKKWERDGLTEWDFDELPETIEAGPLLSVYPALEPGDKSASIRLFQNIEKARKVHEMGVEQLLSIKLAKDIKFLKREWHFPEEAGKAAVYFGGEKVLCEIMHRSIINRLFRKNLRSRGDFENYTRELTAIMLDRFRELREQALSIISAYSSARSNINAVENSNKANPEIRLLCAEIKDHLEKLVPQDFPEVYEADRMSEIPRYIKALEVRVERGANNPEKDLEKTKQVEEFEQVFDRVVSTLSPHASREKIKGVEQLKWMIEEFRVSVFAQEQGTAFPVSVKRLKKHIERLERLI